MTFREAQRADIESMMRIVREAQAWFRAQGIDQWQDGYPTPEILEADIAAHESWVGELDGRVVVMATLSFRGERTYAQIYEGAWLNAKPYGVVHRMATATKHKGEHRAEAMMLHCFEECRKRGVEEMRIDTHRDNRPMQRLIQRMGFLHCGRIVLESGAGREAYQRSL